MALPPIDLAVFHDNGFVRKQCTVTDLWFWTSDEQRTTCGDTSEDEYTFIGAPLISGFDQRGKALKDAMREAFLSFFENVEHTRIEPYPVFVVGVMTFTSPSPRLPTSNPMSPRAWSNLQRIHWPSPSRAFD